MIYYILHQLPIWNYLPNGKRNARIFAMAVILYILLYSLSYQYKNTNSLCYTINNFFIWIMAGDGIINAVNYRMHYGRSIIREFKSTNDVYDAENDRYIQDGYKKKESQYNIPTRDLVNDEVDEKYGILESKQESEDELIKHEPESEEIN